MQVLLLGLRQERVKSTWATTADRPQSCMTKFQARKTTMEDILEDPEAIAQLYLLWTNKISNNSESGRNLVELSQQIDKGYVKEERKPIYR